MISRVKVTNYQALQDVDLELGRFTVIQGPSSSGKSGFIRALRLLVSNARGTTYVTRGQKTAVVEATVSDSKTGHHVVSIRRGGVNGYKVDEAEFTKIATDVPETVSWALGMAPDNPVNFAGQFDRPYLLDETAGSVARTLGELTNVTVILNAAREAARRRLAVAGELKTREAQLATLTEAAEAFRSLPGRMADVTVAEEALSVSETLSGTIARLANLTATLGVAEAAVARLAVDAAPLPDIEATFVEIAEASVRFDRFCSLMAQLGPAATRVKEAQSAIYAADTNLAATEAEIHSVLVDAGACPLCGQSTAALPTPV